MIIKKLVAFIALFTALVIPSVVMDAADDMESSQLVLRFDVVQHRFNKYSMPTVSVEIGGEKYTQSVQIGRDTKNVEMTFDALTTYAPGTPIKVTGEYGLTGIRYYDYYALPGEIFDVYTYVIPGENGDIHNNIVDLTLDPLYYKDVDMFINYKPVTFTEPVLMAEDEYAFVPIIELANALGISDAKYFPEYNCVRIAVDKTTLVYYLDSDKIEINGEESVAVCQTQFVGSTIFAPLRHFADVFETELTFTDEVYKFNINLGDSAVLTRYNNWYEGKAYVVNERGISSDTEYLVWVSKSEYKVRVFKGSKGNWNFVASMPCAIGAPGSPTCEGTYKYYQYQTRWSYANYYCGPIMRFNGGYALHSTLIKYNGVPYDNRVGMKISHGCVRLRPENINWLASTVPLMSTIYITP